MGFRYEDRDTVVTLDAQNYISAGESQLSGYIVLTAADFIL